MAQALIQSLLNGDLSTVVEGQSRNDLSFGDKVYLKSVGDGANTYSWNLLYKPEGSTASFSGNPTSVTVGFFEVDKEGSYLVRLIINAGNAGESTQYLRLRALTQFGNLHLVSAGERKTFEDSVPSDIDISGWTNDQNRNLLTLLDFIKPLVSSGRVLYVDANDGTKEYGNHSSIQEAIDYASAASPNENAPYTIMIRAGLYTGDLTLKPHVHLVGFSGDSSVEDRRVVIDGLITTDLPNIGDHAFVTNLYIKGDAATTNPLVTKSGNGTLSFVRTHIMQTSSSVGQGATLSVEGGVVNLDNCKVTANDGGLDDQFALVQKGASVINARRTEFIAPSCIHLNVDREPANTMKANFVSCEISSTGGVTSSAVSGQSQADFDHCLFDVNSGKAFDINSSGGSLVTGDIVIQLRWSFIPTEVYWNVNDTDGLNEIRVGAIQWLGLQESGVVGFPPHAVKITPLVGGDTIGYDGVASADNIQDAIDETYSLTNITGGNVGTGTRVFKQKNSNVLEFKTLVGDSTVNVSSTTNEIQLGFSGAVSSIYQDNTSITIVDEGGLTDGSILINIDGVDYWMFDTNGSFLPMNTGTQDIGSATNRVQSIYVDAISSVHFVYDDGASQFDYPLNIDVSDTSKPELLFNGIPIATPFEEKFYEVKGTDIGWYNDVKLLASPLKYDSGYTGVPVLLIEDTTMAGTSVTNDKGQAINLKNLTVVLKLSGENGTIDDTILTEIVVDVYVGNEEASFSVTGYSFDTLQEIELPLDIPNIPPEEKIRVEIFFIRNPNSSVEIPVLPLGVEFGYVLQ